MRHLIVAHHGEPLTWVNHLMTTHPWTVSVVTNGQHRPNTGREAGAYLWWIVRNYERLQPWDFYAFVQADPFPHCEDILDRLLDVPGGWQPLGGWLCESYADGGPHHGGLPIQSRYEELLGQPFPDEGITFHAGGQWMARGNVLRQHPKAYYEQLADIADDEATGGPWVLERLWAVIFGRRAETHGVAEGMEVTTVDG